MKHITAEFEERLRARLKDLKDKEAFMRSPASQGGGFPRSILIGRMQGQIGEVEHILREAGCA